MAQQIAEKFLKDSAEKSFDQDHREIMQQHVDQYNYAFEEAKHKFYNLENSKKKANLIKWTAIENLDHYLVDFETNFTKRGGKVIWANDAQEALEEINKIIDLHEAKLVVKAKSIATEEIGLSKFLEKESVELVETDLAEFLIQFSSQQPSYMSTPAPHLRLADIVQHFHEKYEMPIDATAEQLLEKVRMLLREKYSQADIGITGADFLIADTGNIAITENEGNARLAATFPKVHIAIAGIEKILPNLLDIDLFWPLLSSHETGQNLKTYNSILSGPRQSREADGPEEMYVILLDNGRSKLLAEKEQRQGLYCISCGSCLNVCPVYQNIGAQTYNSRHQGPIGSLIAPHAEGFKKFKHLSQASTLCGKCTEVCPVGIDIHNMLLLNRRKAVELNQVASSEKSAWKRFTYALKRRKVLDFFGVKFKNFLFGYFFKKPWGAHRDLPKMADKSFSKQWKEQEKNGG